MIIQTFENLPACGTRTSVDIKLPHPNLILDPRLNWPRFCRFDCRYHTDGVTVTLTRIGNNPVPGGYVWNGVSFQMRVYDPKTEVVPRFDTTTYIYLGVDGERAPLDTIVGIIDPNVKMIKESAFCRCKMMRKCIMHGQVHTIQQFAFNHCASLEALFLSSSLKKIGVGAFLKCENIRILPLPTGIDFRDIEKEILWSCDTFFSTTQIQNYQYDRHDNGQVHKAIIDFYCNNIPSLHKLCLGIDVSTENIHECILQFGSSVASIVDHDGMIPLHILAMNPHADSGAIMACFGVDMSAAFVGDSRGETPLDYLKEYNFDGYTTVVTSLCMHREAASK